MASTIPENAAWPAENDVNVVIIGLRPATRACVERYLEVRANAGKPADRVPLMGVSKHVVVADTDAEAMRLARRAYLPWRESFIWLFKRHGAQPRIIAALPPTFDELMAIGNGVAGSPDDGARLDCRGSGGDRHQLFRLVARLRRPHGGGIATLAGPADARSDAGIRRRARGRRGVIQMR